MTKSDDRFEHLVSEMLQDTAPSRLPNGLLPEIEAAVDGARRWPSWWVAIRVQPMRLASTLAVGSPTARAGAIMLTGSWCDPAATWRRSSSTRTSASPATGRDEIVLIAPADGPTNPGVRAGRDPYAIVITAGAPAISDLTPRELPSAIHVLGGSPIRRNVLSGNELGITLAGSSARLEANIIENGRDGVILMEGSAPTMVDNSVSGNERVGAWLWQGPDPTLTGNRICGNGNELDFLDAADERAFDDTNQICQAMGSEP